MDEIKLRYFVSAARHLSFTKAAEDCNVTQSTISKQISALEEELGSKLFSRDHNALTLTATGLRLAQKAEDYMDQYRMINESVRRLHLEYNQRLTIGVGPWEWALLSRPLSLFVKKYPDVEIFTGNFTHKRLASHLRSGTLDVGICSELCIANIRNLYAKSLGFSRFEAAAHRNHEFWLLTENDRVSFKDQTMITLFENEYEPVRSYCVSHNKQQIYFTHGNYFPVLAAMVRAKMGISLMPYFSKDFVGSDIRFDNLLAPPLVQQFFVAKNQSGLSEPAMNFIEICTSCYDNAPEIGDCIAVD
jgi:DNA-binding transcriptional LysR family regulator